MGQLQYASGLGSLPKLPTIHTPETHGIDAANHACAISEAISTAEPILRRIDERWPSTTGSDKC